MNEADFLIFGIILGVGFTLFYYLLVAIFTNLRFKLKQIGKEKNLATYNAMLNEQFQGFDFKE